MDVYHRTGTPCHGVGHCPLGPDEHFASLEVLFALILAEDEARRARQTAARPVVL